jgi:subfamily B ATP-binding cassette protein MsbA
VNVGLRVSNALQGRLVNHMLGLDQRFFQDNAPGALIERVRGDTLALQKLATSTLITAGRDTVTLLSLIAVMLVTDWVWTLTALIGIPLLVVPLALVQSYIRTTTLKSREAAARLSTRLDEIFHGIQTIKLNRLERSEDKRFDRELTRFRRPAMRAQVGQAANPALMDLIAAAGFVAVLWFGGQQIIEGREVAGRVHVLLHRARPDVRTLAASVQRRGSGAGGTGLARTHLHGARRARDGHRPRKPRAAAARRHPLRRRAFRL